MKQDDNKRDGLRKFNALVRFLWMVRPRYEKKEYWMYWDKAKNDAGIVSKLQWPKS